MIHSKNLVKTLVMALFLVVLLSITSLMAQTSSFTDNAKSYSSGTGDGMVINFTGVVDSTADSLYSKTFSLGNYDAESFYTYPVNSTLLLSGGTASTQKVNIFVLGSNTPGATSSNLADFVTCDTIAYEDSSTTILYKTFNMNGAKYAKYMLFIQGTAGNVLTNFSLPLYLYRRDH